MRTTISIGRWATTVAAGVPLPALACPNCYSSSGPRVLLMYYLSTLALSVMPFAIVGTIAGLAAFLKRQLQEDAEDPVPVETSP
jgi:hypothetical protein